MYNYNGKKRIPSEFTIGYKINASESYGSSHTNTNYRSATSESSSREFDRIYDQQDELHTKHVFSASYPGLRRLIFNERSLAGIQMGLSGIYTIDENRYINKVWTRDH